MLFCHDVGTSGQYMEQGETTTADPATHGIYSPASLSLKPANIGETNPRSTSTIGGSQKNSNSEMCTFTCLAASASQTAHLNLVEIASKPNPGFNEILEVSVKTLTKSEWSADVVYT